MLGQSFIPGMGEDDGGFLTYDQVDKLKKKENDVMPPVVDNKSKSESTSKPNTEKEMVPKKTKSDNQNISQTKDTKEKTPQNEKSKTREHLPHSKKTKKVDEKNLKRPFDEHVEQISKNKIPPDFPPKIYTPR